MGAGGNLLMDAPPAKTFDELIVMAADRKAWKVHVVTKFGKCESKASQTNTISVF